MPQMLNDGAIEYEDGTPATEAQVGLPLKISPWNNKKLSCCMLSHVLLIIKLKLFSDAVVQMGKDVVSFLTWAAEPEMEERKLVHLLLIFVSIMWRILKNHILFMTLSVSLFCNDILYVQMQMGFKWIFVLSLALLQAGYYRRLKWSVLKSRKLVLDVVN